MGATPVSAANHAFRGEAFGIVAGGGHEGGRQERGGGDRTDPAEGECEVPGREAFPRLPRDMNRFRAAGGAGSDAGQGGDEPGG